MKGMKRFLAALAVLVLMAGCFPITEARADAIMYVTASYLYLRSAAGPYGAIIGGAKQGTAVTAYSSPKYDYWYYVRLPNGMTGYMYKGYLSFGYNIDTDNKVTPISGTATTSRDVNLRTGPGYDYGVIYLTPKGTSVTLTGKYGNWYAVKVGGVSGYMLASLLTTGGNNGGGGAAYTVTTASGTATTSRDVNLRTGPGYNYTVIYLAPKGTNVTITGKSGTWYRVSISGTTGFMLASLLNVSAGGGGGSYTVTAASGTAVTSREVNLRTGPGYDYKVIYLTPKGTTVTITGKSGNWYRVSVSGTTGFMLASLLNVKANNNGGGNNGGGNTMNVSAYTNHDANMRSGASSNHTIMYTLKKGEWLTVIGSNGAWYKIIYNGQTGWMLKTLVELVNK